MTIPLRFPNPRTREVRLGAVRSVSLPHHPSRELNPISFPVSFPCYVKVLTPPGLLQLALPGAVRVCSFYSRSRATRTTNINIISFRKGSNNRFAASAGTKSGASTIGEAGEPGLRPLLLKGKSPQSAWGWGEQCCRGRGSSGLPWGHFSVT